MIVEDIMGVSSKCANASMAGVGSFGCPFKFQLPDGIILIKKGYFVPNADDFNAAYLLNLVQTGIAVPLLDSFAFEPINEDDVKETSVTGVNALARKGLTELMFTYKKGIEYEKALELLTSFGVFDVWVVDKSGNFLGIEKSGGFGGFAAGLVLAKSRIWNDGSASEGKEIEVQLTQPGEVKFITWFEVEQLGFFAPTEIDGVNTVKISYADANGAVVPADTDTTLNVQVLASDGKTPILGLDLADFDSTSVVTAVVEDGEGFYTLTITALVAAATETTKLRDSTKSTDVVDVAGILFAGTVSTVVV